MLILKVIGSDYSPVDSNTYGVLVHNIDTYSACISLQQCLRLHMFSVLRTFGIQLVNIYDIYEECTRQSYKDISTSRHVLLLGDICA